MAAPNSGGDNIVHDVFDEMPTSFFPLSDLLMNWS
uniref:Uncharacterized protein n=1 Tax=Arundo donax TaxID=35708 RepID=A0A0A9ASV8_ARUDO